MIWSFLFKRHDSQGYHLSLNFVGEQARDLLTPNLMAINLPVIAAYGAKTQQPFYSANNSKNKCDFSSFQETYFFRLIATGTRLGKKEANAAWFIVA